MNEASVRSFIHPSTSPAGAPFFFDGNVHGTLRPCRNYSSLNDITFKNQYPLGFTEIDLRNANSLVRIHEDDEGKTAFNSPKGGWEYLVMSFCFANAPVIFQALVKDMLCEKLN